MSHHQTPGFECIPEENFCHIPQSPNFSTKIRTCCSWRSGIRKSCSPIGRSIRLISVIRSWTSFADYWTRTRQLVLDQKMISLRFCSIRISREWTSKDWRIGRLSRHFDLISAIKTLPSTSTPKAPRPPWPTRTSPGKIGE